MLLGESSLYGPECGVRMKPRSIPCPEGGSTWVLYCMTIVVFLLPSLQTSVCTGSGLARKSRAGSACAIGRCVWSALMRTNLPATHTGVRYTTTPFQLQGKVGEQNPLGGETMTRFALPFAEIWRPTYAPGPSMSRGKWQFSRDDAPKLLSHRFGQTQRLSVSGQILVSAVHRFHLDLVALPTQ